MASTIKINRRNLTLKKSYNEPHFNGKSVLVSDPWEYVELWLKRNNNSNDALFYWQQAKQFYEATLSLPLASAPLTSYYCFLNATKTLLLIRGVNFSDMYGVSGYRKKSKLALSNEMIILKSGGIMPALCKCFALNFVCLPKGRTFSYLQEGKRRIAAISRVTNKYTTASYYLIEVSTVDNRSLSTLLIRYNSDIGDESIIKLLLKQLVYNSGSWNSNCMKNINYERIKHVKQDERKWAQRILNCLI